MHTTHRFPQVMQKGKPWTASSDGVLWIRTLGERPLSTESTERAHPAGAPSAFPLRPRKRDHNHKPQLTAGCPFPQIHADTERCRHTEHLGARRKEKDRGSELHRSAQELFRAEGVEILGMAPEGVAEPGAEELPEVPPAQHLPNNWSEHRDCSLHYRSLTNEEPFLWERLSPHGLWGPWQL